MILYSVNREIDLVPIVIAGDVQHTRPSSFNSAHPNLKANYDILAETDNLIIKHIESHDKPIFMFE